MTRQEIEGYLLHAKVSPETFVLDEQADLLFAEFARLRRATLEEAARAVCERCKEETPIRDTDGDAFWHAPERFGSTWCDASPIRDLIAELDKEGDRE